MIPIDSYKPAELDKLSKSLPEKRAEIIPDNNSINNIINNVAYNAKQAVEEGKKTFNKFTSGIASKVLPAKVLPANPLAQASIIKDNNNLTPILTANPVPITHLPNTGVINV